MNKEDQQQPPVPSEQWMVQTLKKALPSISAQSIIFRQLGGLTNTVYSVLVDGYPTYLFKSYSKGFDRQHENKIANILSQKQLYPKVYYTDKECRIQQYINHATHPPVGRVRNDKELLGRIMQRMAKYHELPFDKNTPTLTHQAFSHQIVEKVIQEQHQESYDIKAYTELWIRVNKVIGKDRKVWEERLVCKEAGKIRFCHNDLNNLNILQVGKKLHFVDLDYTGPNFLSFDIADLLNQACIDYQGGKYPGFTHVHTLSMQEITDATKLYPYYQSGLEWEVLRSLCVCNLHWAEWSITRLRHNPDPLFGIIEHGILRMNLFDHYLSLIGEHKYD